MNLTNLLIESIQESSQTLLKISALKLESKLDKENLQELIGDTLDEEQIAEIDWDQVISEMEKDTEFDKVFTDIKNILTSIEGLEESAVTKSVSLVAKGIELAAINIAESYNKKVDAKVETLKESLEETIEARYQDAATDWAQKKEQELKENNDIDSEDLDTLREAGKFVLALNTLFSDSGLSFDTSITENVENLQEELDTLKEENLLLKKKQGQIVKDDIFTEVTENLSNFEREKLKSLARGLVFITNEDYKEKLTELKDAFKGKKKDETDDEEDDGKDKEDDSKSAKGKQMKKLGEEVSRMFGAPAQL